MPGSESYSAGRYAADVARVLEEARREGRRPIIVGGTGLYFKTLTEGLSPMPEIPDDVRAHWRARRRTMGAAHLHDVLTTRDAEMAGRLASGDTQRVVRALEVLDATGVSLAEWQRRPREPVLNSPTPFRSSSRLSGTSSRGASMRAFAQMMEEGGLEEVLQLKALDLDPSLPVMTALGVRPLLRHLAGELSLDEAIAAGQLETRQYAKRQVTWARGNMIAWKCHSHARNATISRRFRIFYSDCTLTLHHRGLRFRRNDRPRPHGGTAASLELAMARTMTGAEMVIAALADQGVEHIFGYPGGAVLPIYDELFQQDKVRHILVRQEGGALHAAEGYARSTGKVGVALVTSGPGATNAVTGLTDALMDSHPARLHHRAGADASDRQRRVPGVRHGRHHAALHQAQLAGEERQRPGARASTRRSTSPRRAAPARWSSTSRRTSSSRPATTSARRTSPTRPTSRA